MANVITDFRFYMTRRHRPELAYVGYEEAEKIVVLADPKSLENAEPLLRQLHTDGKAISLFVYNPLSEPLSGGLPAGRVFTFGKKELGWLSGVPKAAFRHQFEAVESDVLLDLTLEEVLPLTYLTACSKARLKMGFHKSGRDVYDFTIRHEPPFDSLDLLRNLLFYWRKIDRQ